MLITPRVNQCENMWKRWQTCFYKSLAPFVTEDWQTSSLCTAGAWCRSSASANGTRHQSGSSVFTPLKCPHVAGKVCKVGSFCRTKYMRQCPCRERGRQSFFFFFRLCERNCRNFCSPWFSCQCTDILWLLDPMTFTDSHSIWQV